MLDPPHLILSRYTVTVKCCCYKFNYCEIYVTSCDDLLLLASSTRHVACMGGQNEYVESLENFNGTDHSLTSRSENETNPCKWLGTGIAQLV